MIKLTIGQFEELAECFEREDILPGYRPKIMEMLKLYHDMLAASPTHRVVEAPEGYEFGGGAKADLRIDPAGPNAMGRFSYFIKPIPKPCPAPMLEPVTVTVESVYRDDLANALKACEGFKAEFGMVEDLKHQGFTHYVTSAMPCVAIMSTAMLREYRICLRKWEGK